MPLEDLSIQLPEHDPTADLYAAVDTGYDHAFDILSQPVPAEDQQFWELHATITPSLENYSFTSAPHIPYSEYTPTRKALKVAGAKLRKLIIANADPALIDEARQQHALLYAARRAERGLPVSRLRDQHDPTSNTLRPIPSPGSDT